MAMGLWAVACVMGAGLAAAGEKHACLAYSEATHRFGWAVDQPTEAQATQKALADCGPGCTARLNWHNGCGAYAEGQQNIHYGWAIGPTKEGAQSAALSACSGRGGKNCTIRNWACN
jgi:hypothetical protein